ncbi:ras-related protein Rab-35-like [Ylistrum balloti]|uniref:ras-related protein Rab-35-like n=1 Tax=Ylistrum balloti TaxID=509963 RepID=UPI002905F57E|nr:ras-related protein Rab-35-like [Ylistrum balloti]
MPVDDIDWRRPLFKVILLGEVGVGKSSLFLRVKDNTFIQGLQPTVGIESCVKTLYVEDEKVALVLWDTAGVEKFKTMTRNYYRNTHAAVLVYDVNNPASLQYLSKWANDALDFAPNALRFIMGNKSDLERNVITDSTENFRYAHNCECVLPVSALTGEGIDNALTIIATKLMGAYKTPLFYESLYNSTVEITRYQPRQRGKPPRECCQTV